LMIFIRRNGRRITWQRIRRAGDYEFWNLDICEIDRLRRVMEHSKPDVIIHLAARAGVQFSLKQPELYEQVNVAGTRNLLELAIAISKSRDFSSVLRVQSMETKLEYHFARMK